MKFHLPLPFHKSRKPRNLRGIEIHLISAHLLYFILTNLDTCVLRPCRVHNPLSGIVSSIIIKPSSQYVYLSPTSVRYMDHMDHHPRCLSPPPRMPSPQLLPTPLPSPPLHHQQSRSRLQVSSQSKPPSPLINSSASGSPIISQRNLHAPRALPHPPLDMSLWLDGDDFGARRATSQSPPSPCLTPEGSTPYGYKRQPNPIAIAHSRSRPRPRSPPPSPGRPATPPPVPPIPTHFLGVTPGKPVLQPRSTNHLTPVPRTPDLPPPQSHGPLLRKSRSSDAMTCIRFLTLHDDQ
jgi:hypothetical protein